MKLVTNETPRLTADEMRICEQQLKLDLSAINGTRPKAVIVNEAPTGDKQWGALFPYPYTTHGARLRGYSAQGMLEYLQTYQRINLVDSVIPKAKHLYPRRAVRMAARMLMGSIATLGWPMVLCGTRVAEAFDLYEAEQYRWYYLQTMRSIGTDLSEAYAAWGTEGLPNAPVQVRVAIIANPGSLYFKRDEGKIRKILAEARA